MYEGTDFDDLYGGEKAAVTKRFNAQREAPVREEAPVRGADAVEATIGRVGVNGTKHCFLNEGATIKDLLSQAGYGFDTKKETITEKTTGESVELTDEVENGGVYVISTEIESA